jgi:hypothetical protein
MFGGFGPAFSRIVYGVVVRVRDNKEKEGGNERIMEGRRKK